MIHSVAWRFGGLISAAWALAALLGSCTGSDTGSRGRQSTIQISITAESLKPKSKAPWRSVPRDVSGYDCLLVNVMGDGIANRKPGGNQASFSSILAGSYCGYPGILSNYIPIPTTGATSVTAKLLVPVGTNRVVQVVGIVNPNGCTGTVDDLLSSFSEGTSTIGVTGIYELGRATVDTTVDRVVTIANSNDPQDVTCGGLSSYDCSGKTSTTFASGSGTPADPYYICSASQLANVASNLSSAFVLASNIDLTATTWTPIGNNSTPFTGLFDGGNFQVSTSDYGSGTQDLGLFGWVGTGAVVQNLKVSGNITIGVPANDVGLVVGTNCGTLTNIHAAGTLTLTGGGNNVGGVVGCNGNSGCSGTLDTLTSSASVQGGALRTGGLVGWHYSGTLDNSISTGLTQGTAVVGGGVGAAGITSIVSGNISNTRAIGAVSSSASNAGGLIGYLSEGSITKSSATGSVTSGPSSSSTGGFAGLVDGPSSTISQSYATGAVTGYSNVGGFVGTLSSNASVTNCYTNFSTAIGVSGGGGSNFGGFVGQIQSSGSATYNYVVGPSSGVPSGQPHHAPFAGDASAPGTTTPNVSVLGLVTNDGYGLDGTTELLSNMVNLSLEATVWAGFNFTTIWNHPDGTNPPTLR